MRYFLNNLLRPQAHSKAKKMLPKLLRLLFNSYSCLFFVCKQALGVNYLTKDKIFMAFLAKQNFQGFPFFSG